MNNENSTNNINIIVKSRNYNGAIHKVSIYDNIYKFSLNGDSAVIGLFIRFLVNLTTYKKATAEISIPFVMSEENIKNLNSVVNQISSNKQYIDNISISHEGMVRNIYSYTDVNINGVDYAIKNNDSILSDLTTAIHCSLPNTAMHMAYKEILNLQ